MKSQLIAIVAAVLLVGCGNPDGALFQAVKDINIEAAKQAIADGADVNAKGLYGPGKGLYGLTHLSIAAARGHKEIVELLISKGADVNVRDDLGETPLHAASDWNKLRSLTETKEIVELLIANGADVNAWRDDGDTPLHLVADYAHKEVVELLIAKGADVNAVNRDEETPLDVITITRGEALGLSPKGKAARKKTADLLRKHGGKRGGQLPDEF